MAIVARVDGLADFRRVVRGAAPELDKELRKAMRAAVAPIVSDARAHLNALPGTGPRTAKQVRSSVTQSAVSVSLVPKAGFELAREFGAKGIKVSHYEMHTRRGVVQVTRAMNYASPRVFDRWTGNRFTLDSSVSGRGLFPAASRGGLKAVEQVTAAIERTMQKLGD